jgi:hypothetical protein
MLIKFGIDIFLMLAFRRIFLNLPGIDSGQRDISGYHVPPAGENHFLQEPTVFVVFTD